MVEAPWYSRHPTPILPMQLLNAFKCNLKELKTKSALSAWGQRSLACARPVAGDIDQAHDACFSKPKIVNQFDNWL